MAVRPLSVCGCTADGVVMGVDLVGVVRTCVRRVWWSVLTVITSRTDNWWAEPADWRACPPPALSLRITVQLDAIYMDCPHGRPAAATRSFGCTATLAATMLA